MKKKTFLYVLRLALTLLAITAVMAAALAGVNKLTTDRIAEAKQDKLKSAIEEVLPDAGFIQMSENDPARSGADMVKNVYVVYNEPPDCSAAGGYVIGYAVEVIPSGFNGEITMIVGFDLEQKVTGVSVVSHTETAGLGAVAGANNAKGQAFREQFAGQSGKLAVKQDGGSIDAITGATITSRAVVEGINEAAKCIEWFTGLLKQG